ncbi:hypothetical protein CN692_18735 [Bacillus sp. AFS002410]|uniref:hypothetical protein n=1 Tax=Bacillus sp. AFS002410 TaxID=2033481 RepID=UPI000BEFB683|nr:hypothetical protein [Bacillus sp. AFS002410]PEJ56164.1 hypothetical protein CN692_18735 [Bacillus sp. AFS002410]
MAEQRLIKNSAESYYAVKVVDELYVRGLIWLSQEQLEGVDVGLDSCRLAIHDLEEARFVANFINGKVVKIIRTKIITENIEEVIFND